MKETKLDVVDYYMMTRVDRLEDFQEVLGDCNSAFVAELRGVLDGLKMAFHRGLKRLN